MGHIKKFNENWEMTNESEKTPEFKLSYTKAVGDKGTYVMAIANNCDKKTATDFFIEFGHILDGKYGLKFSTSKVKKDKEDKYVVELGISQDSQTKLKKLLTPMLNKAKKQYKN